MKSIYSSGSTKANLDHLSMNGTKVCLRLDGSQTTWAMLRSMKNVVMNF